MIAAEKIHLSITNILFRVNQFSGKEEFICAKCLSFNLRTEKQCSNCRTSLVDYDEKTFWNLRRKFISEDQTKDISLSAKTLENDINFEQKFNEQLEHFQPIFKIVKFINNYSITKLKIENFGITLLALFPLPEDRINQLKSIDFDFRLQNQNASLISDKLFLIEKKSVLDNLANFSFNLKSLMTTFEDATTIRNLEWLKINTDYYIYNGNVTHTKDTDAELRKFKDYAFAVNDHYELEVALSPLHWKNIIENNIRASSGKSLISKKRYKIILELLTPQNKAQKAWQKLGIAYCSNDLSAVSDIDIQAYYAEQISMPFSDRDNTFLFSHMAVFQSSDVKVMDFPEKYDSYYIPLINFIADINSIEQFFSGSDNTESITRAFYYYDFKKSPYLLKGAAERILHIANFEDIKKNILHGSPLIRNELFILCLSNEKTELLELFFKNTEFTWPESLDKSTFENLTEKSLMTLLNNIGSLKGLTLADWSKAIFKQTVSADFLKQALFELRRTYNDHINPWPLFCFWFDLAYAKQNEKSEIAFTEIGYFMKGKLLFNANHLQEKFLDNHSIFTDFLWNNLTSNDDSQMQLIISFLNTHVDNRATSTDVFADKSPEKVVHILMKILTTTGEQNISGLCIDLIREYLAQSKIIDQQIMSLWDTYINIKNSDCRNNLELILKKQNCIKKITEGEKKTVETVVNEQQKILEEKNAAKLQKELDLAKRKLEQAEEQRKMIEERDKANAEAQLKVQLKSQQYQIKASEMQMWYQTEVTKIMMSQESALEKNAKMTALAFEYQKKQMELSMWMATN